MKTHIFTKTEVKGTTSRFVPMAWTSTGEDGDIVEIKTDADIKELAVWWGVSPELVATFFLNIETLRDEVAQDLQNLHLRLEKLENG